MQLSHILFSQGFGTRRVCAARIHAGTVQVNGQVVDDPATDFDVVAPFCFSVDGVLWPYVTHALVMLHKPVGYECSMKPRHHPSVLSLLPEPLRVRGLQPVGRLDVDTTGLLLLTDDGGLLHRLTSPKHHVDKVYEVTTKHAVDPSLVQRLLAGVVLDDAPEIVRANACKITGDHGLQLVIDQGKYHQVKRMVAAAGNRVEVLHRSAFGPWALPAALKPSHWVWASASIP